MTRVLPKVSVIIPHYNMHHMLPRAVGSVAIQKYANKELIIIDDGSDASIDQKQLPTGDMDTTIIEIDHGGKPGAVNRGFEEASGKYIAILDADDQLPKNSLATRVGVLEDKEADLCIGSFEVRYSGQSQSLRSTRELSGLSKRHIIRKLLSHPIAPFHQNAMFFSRSLQQRAGAMDTAMIRSQDKDFAIRLLEKSSKHILIDNPVYIYQRYDRPLQERVRNRLMGMRYKLAVTARHLLGWRRTIYVMWGLTIGGLKLIHDLFGIYKK